ncbi:hypothetical protein L1987_76277 [Smallanthus sonchifolius]|uniref:Uncharacterized protein n=1 Tax=Smallanthus sonchifolius TaxID=185202 RepID=A0ACB9A7R1_9ASTR|nr:hypothetical protein L1987_76277 [Smallanthus sonchifolius]
MSFPLSAPTFVPKNMFVQYLKNYVYRFNVDPVESAWYDRTAQKWVVTIKNMVLGLIEEYVCEFLVVATGENSEGFIPIVYGLDSFKGLVIHFSEYKNGKKFGNKDVLVVGAINSGMEIAYDLCNWGAQTSIVIRSPDDGGLFNEAGMPKHKSPNHWKGEDGLYCVGFVSAGLFGISNDAQNIANDISRIMHGN